MVYFFTKKTAILRGAVFKGSFVEKPALLKSL